MELLLRLNWIIKWFNFVLWKISRRIENIHNWEKKGNSLHLLPIFMAIGRLRPLRGGNITFSSSLPESVLSAAVSSLVVWGRNSGSLHSYRVVRELDISEVLRAGWRRLRWWQDDRFDISLWRFGFVWANTDLWWRDVIVPHIGRFTSNVYVKLKIIDQFRRPICALSGIRSSSKLIYYVIFMRVDTHLGLMATQTFI